MESIQLLKVKLELAQTEVKTAGARLGRDEC